MDSYKQQSFRDITVNDGFWKKKQEMVSEKTIYAVYDRFVETGRISVYDWTWKPGEPNQPQCFWDSDVAKWIESAAYIIQKKKDDELIRRCEDLINKIAEHQDKCGYFNSYFQICDPYSRFLCRESHELYSCGHFIEAAVAYYYATGNDKLVHCMEKYVDYIERRFIIDYDAKFLTPFHEEIELALIKLYNLTKNEKYLRLSKFFIDMRGNNDKEAKPEHTQSHKPVREQTEAIGHSVCAGYLYTGMADVARETNDETLFSACKTLFSDVHDKKLYITGGVGSSAWCESFSCEYDLPNVEAYTESCAAIALAFFCLRMQLIDNKTVYADTVERIIYNGFLSSVSLDGEKFFYENPLEYDRRLWERPAIKKNAQHLPITERQKIFEVSCCPPNITRFIASIGNFIYSSTDSRINILQYIASETEINGRKIKIETDYPKSGDVKVSVSGGKPCELAFRIPEWCDKYTSSADGKEENKWFVVALGENETEISFNMEMEVKYYRAKTDVRIDCGLIAVKRGPMLYCAESADNGLNLRDIRIDVSCKPELEFNDTYNAYTVKLAGTRSVETSEELYYALSLKREKVKIKLIPYYAFSNRENTEMLVWFDYN